MNATQIHKTYKAIIQLLAHHHIVEALDRFSSLENELQTSELKNKLENIRQNYTYLLQYFIDGVEDPERETIYHRIVGDLYLLAARYRELLLTRVSNNYEFSQIRHFTYHTQLSAEEIRDGLGQKESVTIEEDNQHQADETAKRKFEQVVNYLFQYYWLKSSYDNDALQEIYTEVMDDSYQDTVTKSMIVSAITLNLWRTFDTSKMLRLLDACRSNDPNVSQRAWVGLAFAMTKYSSFLPYFPTIRDRLSILLDDPQHTHSLHQIILQIIATTETEALGRRFREEVYPELMKIKPLMEDQETLEDLFKTDEWGEINPDWQDIIKEYQSMDKIQEFTEMGMSGSDVYMGTFSHLKSFPFFNKTSNWFIPFDAQHSSLMPLMATNSEMLLSTILTLPMMCNSDKYSFCFNMLQMPDGQRKIMEQSVGASMEQIGEMTKEVTSKNADKEKQIISRHYIQDLFRFFKLNVNRKDFSDMFSVALHLHKGYLFELLTQEKDELKNEVADYYFSKKLYTYALQLYEQIDTPQQNQPAMYQKMGYALQQSSRIKEALLTYQKADLIQPDDFWTNRKIAMCYRLLGEREKAIAVYRQLQQQRPNNISVRLQLVQLLEDTKQIKEAFSELSDAHKAYPKHANIIRKTIHLALVDSNIAQAQYFQSLLFDLGENSAEDHLVAGHLAWIMNKHSDAKAHYQRAKSLLKENQISLDTLFDKTEHLLLNNGVEAYEISLVVEALKNEQ